MSTFDVTIPVRWGDMDAYGHVNNVAMLALMEEARIALFGPPPASGEPNHEKIQAVIPLFEMMGSSVQALIAEHSVKYKAQLPYTGEPVTVRMALEKVSAASITLSYSFISPKDGRECVRASTVLAFWDTRAGSLVRLTKEQRELLASYAG